ncbi:hypothetical protein KFU94_59260, partial [Chloroflexi bacterium TSY]|nr:hypothetical protein [Chloroflexi bacterium TSY]
MDNPNRRTFLGFSAASIGVTLLGSTGCTALFGTEADMSNAPVLFSEAIAEADGVANAVADEAMLTANISQAASHLLDGLDDAQREQTTYEFASEERFRWHWTSPRRFPRNSYSKSRVQIYYVELEGE